ncbi:hypothetical protein VPKG_00059 [Vibrio phage pYD21-A]|uniref:hypothetical protein n=1 Tax=Vibrio phage pYD21-A TaxID=754049 RepID=UPI0002C0D7E0|nr:hypothetical protein VPKG_00059 [Vibrio phage pYD21-A]AGH16096.1 hypothetical protein VPKG_00059 [Vibrio phage pYD21-A]
MKKVEVTHQLPNGKTRSEKVNTSGTAKGAAEALSKVLPKSWKLVSYEVVKEH